MSFGELIPLDIDASSEDESQQLERERRLEQIRREIGKARERERARKERMRADDSSEDETTQATVKINEIKDVATDAMKDLTLTPNGSTPPDTTAESESKPVEEKLDPKLSGMSVGLKHLYSGKEDKRGRFQWQTTIPEDVGKPAEDAETQKWALIVRHVKVFNDPKKVLAMHSIVIQSPLLKELLRGVLSGYPGVTVDLDRLEFSGKFEPLIHRWSELKAAIEKLRRAKTNRTQTTGEQETDVEADKTKSDDAEADKTEAVSQDDLKLQHAELLYNLLSSEFQTSIDSSVDMKAKGVMTYEHLWTLFQPGQLVYNRQEGQDRIFRLCSGKYGQDRDGNPVFWLIMQYVDWDGTKWGTQKLNVMIRQFTGTRPIPSLSTSPLEFHNDKDELRARLSERGGKIEALAGTHYRTYEGMGWRYNACGQKDKFSIKGRIVIDTYGWNRFMPNYSIYVNALNIKEQAKGNDSDSDDEFNPDDEYDDDMDEGMPVDGHFADEDEENQRQPLTEEQRLICTHLLRGYSLKDKAWLNLYVNSVKDIAFNTRAFESLVLPESQKELILGFTASQQACRTAYDDVIEGKGRGIIILLSGPPGVGKTLTAESVAEEMRVPLFVMSAGDLGLDSRHIESRLQNVFEMVTRWNAILLLDEADVFLEERSLHELERNKLVSIFLRVLEYYEGIMFLTTNRVNTFDAAFQSRIHISLDYPELSIDSRKSVWRNFLTQHNVVQKSARDRGPPKASAAKVSANAASTTAPTATTLEANSTDGAHDTTEKEAAALATHNEATQPHALTESNISKLAMMHMNGRQIKNVLKTAQLLASRKAEALKMDHVTRVLDVTQHLHNSTRETERARSAIFN